MTKILVNENQCEITDEVDTGFLWALDRALSFNVQGAQHTVSYRGFMNKDGEFIKWDGKHRFLSDTLHFPIGLLQRVQEFYANDGRNLDIIDFRPAKGPSLPIDIIKRLKALGKEPYDYQVQAALATTTRDRGIIRLPTGGGKTIVAALIAANFGKKTMVYVIGKDLLYQIHKLFKSLFDQPIGIVGDGLCDIQDINVVSIWTVGQALGLKKSAIVIESEDDEAGLAPDKYKHIRSMLETTKVHIFDECHVAACNTIQTIAANINPEHIYGMSASPWRDDNADMLIECVLGKYLVNISATDLIKGGYLVKPIIKFINIPFEQEVAKNFKTIYKACIVENERRNEHVSKGAVKLVEQGYQTLVLFNSVNHGKILFDKISKQIPCALLSGKDSVETRQLAKDQLESGKISCIIASKIFDIGVDLPSLSGLVVASSGKSSVRALQRIGRVIRKYPGKKQAAILDFADGAPFLKQHAIERRKIYSSEEGFEIIWPS